MRPALGLVAIASFVLTGCCSTCGGKCPFSWTCGKSSTCAAPTTAPTSVSQASPASARPAAGHAAAAVPTTPAMAPYEGVVPASNSSFQPNRSDSSGSQLAPVGYIAPKADAGTAPAAPTNFTSPATFGPTSSLPPATRNIQPTMTVPPPPPGVSSLAPSRGIPSAADIAARRPRSDIREEWNSTETALDDRALDDRALDARAASLSQSGVADYDKPVARPTANQASVPVSAQKSIGVTDTLPRSAYAPTAD